MEMNRFIEHKQTWHDFTRYLIVHKFGSIQVDILKEPTDCGGGDRFRTRAFIYGLWVEKPKRKKGLAKALLKRAEEIVKSEGIDSVQLTWSEKDTSREILQHLYINNGYDDKVFSDDWCLLQKELV